MKERHSYDRNDVILQIKNTVESRRGFGDVGTTKDILELEDTDINDHGYQVSNCPWCGYDRVIITHHTNPEFPTPFEYDCANPECSWHTEEEFSEEFEEKYC